MHSRRLEFLVSLAHVLFSWLTELSGSVIIECLAGNVGVPCIPTTPPCHKNLEVTQHGDLAPSLWFWPPSCTPLGRHMGSRRKIALDRARFVPGPFPCSMPKSKDLWAASGPGLGTHPWTLMSFIIYFFSLIAVDHPCLEEPRLPMSSCGQAERGLPC